MIEFILGMACGAALIMGIFFTLGSETEEYRKVQSKIYDLECENERLEDLLEQQKDHIEYLTQANQTLRQNKGLRSEEDL